MPNNYEKQAETLLSNLLRGKSLKDWIDQRCANLLAKAKQNCPPVNLEDPHLLKIVKVNRIVVLEEGQQLAESARLSIGEKEFNITIRRYRSRYSNLKRFKIAHEIAHIFFYDIRHWPPPNMIPLRPGDKILEWTCDLIARSLLLPTNWVNKHLCSESFDNKSVEDQAQTLVSISNTFEVSITDAANRLVSDLSIINLVILKLEHTPDITGDQSKKSSSWRIVWHVKPHFVNDELYIPWGHVASNKRIIPKCSKELNKLLDDSVHSFKKTNAISIAVRQTLFRSSSLGSLAKHLKSHFGESMFPIHLKFFSDTSPDLFLSDEDSLPLNGCYMFIPLPLL